MNQLEDPDMIEALCEASKAGVPIDLIIRGFCCLRPGVPGHTENIRIRSIIGRFLEHSRIFYFANGKQDPVEGEFFIGSADWMFRNLSKRIEVVTPVRATVRSSGFGRFWISACAINGRRGCSSRTGNTCNSGPDRGRSALKPTERTRP